MNRKDLCINATKNSALYFDIDKACIIQISETLKYNHFLKLRYLFSSKLSSISSVMTTFVFGLRISSRLFCCSCVSSAIFSGRIIIFRGSWYSISILLPSGKTRVVGYVRSYMALCFFVIAAVQQLKFLWPTAELPIRASEAIILSWRSTRRVTWCDLKLCAIERSRRDVSAR